MAPIVLPFVFADHLRPAELDFLSRDLEASLP
jgi:hypothetical protein